VLLEIIFILVLSYSNTSAQTYDTITKQREVFKNNPQIPVGKGVFLPLDLPLIAVNPTTNKIYVANPDSNTVSVIDASNDKKISEIPVGSYPRAIGINTYGEATPSSPSMMYIFNQAFQGLSSNTVSVIDGSIDKVAAGVTFNIRPANSGSIWCNNKEYPTNIYLYGADGSKCIARPNKGFEFSSWIENLNHNSTVPLNQSAIFDSPLNSLLSTLGMNPKDTSATFNIDRFGTFTANFKAVPPSVPPEYWIPLYGIIVSTIVGWSIPSIIGWIRARIKRKESVKEYDDIINSLSNAIDRKSLDRINNQVIRAYISEKINEFQYKILDKKISEYYNDIDKSNPDIGQSNNTVNKAGYKRSPI
jgi:YVTN family beta-propeller protein